MRLSYRRDASGLDYLAILLSAEPGETLQDGVSETLLQVETVVQALVAAIGQTPFWKSAGVSQWTAQRGLAGREPARLIALQPQAPAHELMARIGAVQRLLPIFDGAGLSDSPLLPIMDWATWPYRTEHPINAGDTWHVPHPADAARDRYLKNLRQALLAPWLDGSRPLRDPQAFTEFHFQLGVVERLFLYRLLEEGRIWTREACAFGCHPPVLGPALASLLSSDWIRDGGASPNFDRQHLWERGPRMVHLNQAAGEYLSP
jgi:hypothetical protein